MKENKLVSVVLLVNIHSDPNNTNDLSNIDLKTFNGLSRRHLFGIFVSYDPQSWRSNLLSLSPFHHQKFNPCWDHTHRSILDKALVHSLPLSLSDYKSRLFVDCDFLLWCQWMRETAHDFSPSLPPPPFTMYFLIPPPQDQLSTQHVHAFSWCRRNQICD